MFGHRYFGKRFYGVRYFGPSAGATAPATSGTVWIIDYRRRARR